MYIFGAVFCLTALGSSAYTPGPVLSIFGVVYSNVFWRGLFVILRYQVVLKGMRRKRCI